MVGAERAHPLLWLPSLVAIVAIAGLARPATGQGIDRPADERPPLPGFELPEVREPILPEVPVPQEPSGSFSAPAGVVVRGYRIEGSTVFTQEELAVAVAPYAGRTVRSEELDAVRNAVTRLYLERGYVTSGALLPDQDVVDGIIRIQVVEGSLDEILFRGNDMFRDAYLRQRIEAGLGTPLQVGELEERLQILQQHPRIERLSARLRSGEAPGRSVLMVEVREANRLYGGLQFANYEPASIGAYAGRIEAGLASPLGWGDDLRAQFTMSEGLRRFRGGYEIPVTPWDTRLSIDGRYASSEVVESPFDNLVESEFQSYRVGLFHPVYRSLSTSFQAGVFGNWRRTRTKIGGDGFGFPGSGADDDGETTISAFRFVLDWLRRDQLQALAARSQLSVGVDILGATTNGGDEPDSRFVSWLLQLQWARRLPYGIEAIMRADLQVSSDPLVTAEQIAAGGHATVRGYRENQRVRDQAVIGSLELRVPLWSDPEGVGFFQLAPFIDGARLWDNPDRPLGTGASTLSSAGVGLRWALPRYFEANVYWGIPFQSTRTAGDLQDAGVQFRISAQLP